MKGRIIAALFVTVMLAICIMPSADAAGDDGQRMIVKNVYSSEFTSLGTIPAYAENDYFYFIKDSNNHKAFKKYIDGEREKMPDDDFPVIRKGDRVVAYFFSAEKYRDGYDTVVEFYNYIGTAYEGYLQLNFTLEHSVDAVYNFFLEGSTANISWKSDLDGLTAYFGAENISRRAVMDADGVYSVKVKIDSNGAYPLTFVNEVNDDVSASLTFDIGGYDTSSSISVAVICFVLAIFIMYLMYSSYTKPEWSIVKEEDEMNEKKKFSFSTLKKK